MPRFWVLFCPLQGRGCIVNLFVINIYINGEHVSTMRNGKKLFSTIIASAIVLSFLGITFAEEYIKKNPYLDRYDHYDSAGKAKGYIKENTYLHRYEIYDRQGRRDGYVKENPYLRDMSTTMKQESSRDMEKKIPLSSSLSSMMDKAKGQGL